MQLIVDQTQGPSLSDMVVEVLEDPELGSLRDLTGKSVIYLPGDPPNPLPTTVSDLESWVSQVHLSNNPQYGFAHTNLIIRSQDSDEFDLTQTLTYDAGPPALSWTSRGQVGRHGAPSANGFCVGSVKVFQINKSVSPNRPGMLVTKDIDVSSYAPSGVSSVWVTWKVYESFTSEDILTPDGSQNISAARYVGEIPPEPENFEVWVSADDGAHYTRASFSAATTVTAGTKIRVAFVNKSDDPVFVTSYSVLC